MAVTACQNPATEPLIGARRAPTSLIPTTLKLRRRALLGAEDIRTVEPPYERHNVLPGECPPGADGSNESFNRLLARIYRLVLAGFGRHLVEETDDRSLVAGGVAVP